MIEKLIDHHMHTNESPDADPQLTFEDYIEEALKRGIQGVMFTDHVDFDFPQPFFDYLIDYKAYHQKLESLKKLYDLFIGMGVEMGYQPHIKEKMNDFINTHPFDFVICSMHVCDKLDLYNGDFFKGKTQVEAYQRYFENVLESVENYTNYDVYGHIDYIIRYGHFKNRQYDFETHKTIIRNILKAIIKNGKGIEINTSGYRYGLGVSHPQIELLKLYKSLGGHIITIGSDAHFLKDYRKDLEQAMILLKEAGFTHVTHFKNRQPQQISILGAGM